MDAGSGRVLSARIERAAGPWGRMVGLLGRDKLDDDEGMWFDRTGAVHTLGMRFPIDVVFLDAGGIVLRVAHDVRPWRPSVSARGARSIIEFAPGGAARAGIRAGMRLAVSWVSPT